MKAGYYCSLLAEARGQRVIPTVETLLELSRKTLYAPALPEINATLAKTLGKLQQLPHASFSLTVIFGKTPDSRFRDFARWLFDRFRAPLLSIRVGADPSWHVNEIEIASPAELTPEEFEFFLAAMEDYTRSGWRPPRARTTPRHSLAILHDPHEHLPPSSAATLKKFASIGPSLGIGVDLIQRKDLLRLAEYDALFIRETTTLKNHTYRFAMRAEIEGMPVIDDVTSILRCTNKVYLAELLQANHLPAPRTLIINRNNVLDCENALGYPVVLKIPDGSFSRGVHKVADRAELLATSKELFRKSDLILAQEFMYTKFDWRVGVLNNQPLFVSQYFMSRRHWQIVNHTADGRPRRRRVQDPYRRRRARRSRRHRAQGRGPDRKWSLRRRPQADRQGRLRHRDQRQPESRQGSRGRRPEGRTLPYRAPGLHPPHREPVIPLFPDRGLPVSIDESTEF